MIEYQYCSEGNKNLSHMICVILYRKEVAYKNNTSKQDRGWIQRMKKTK